jgi:hypothetical protein
MSPTTDSPSRWPPWIGPAVELAMAAGAVVATGAMFAPSRRMAIAFLLSVPAVALIACVACPFAARRPWRIVRAAAPAVGAGVALLFVHMQAALPAAVVLLGFALGLAGLIELLGVLRVPPRVAGGVGAMVAMVLMTTLFWGTQLGRALGRDAGEATVNALAAANPMLAMCDSAVADFTWQEQGGLMYSRITRLGQDMPLVAPAWWATALLWLAVAAVTWPASILPRRKRRRGAGDSETPCFPPPRVV